MTTPTVVAWHGDPDLKARTVERMRQHAAADRLIRGAYVSYDHGFGRWEGCLHGCLIAEDMAAEQGVPPQLVLPTGPDWHDETEARYGIAADTGESLDNVYENLHDIEVADVAVRLLEAIPVGADLRGLWEAIEDVLDTSGDDERALTAVCDVLAAAPIPTEATA